MTRVDPGIDPRYGAARRVLIDALVALAPHGPAVIVVGAQAVYLRAGDADLTVAPYTTDGDLAIDPGRLEEIPQLAEAMAAAGFVRSAEPGVWLASATVAGEEIGIPVDLIVPEAAAPPGGRRGARLGVHGNRAARRARGLEAAQPHRRQGRRRRRPADARHCASSVAGTFERLVQDPVAGPASREALGLLDQLFGRVGRPGVEMAKRALQLALAEQEVEALCVAYAQALLRAVGRTA
jgi:hypothetical protein